MAELAEKMIRENSDWEIISPAQLGIVNFRYVSNREAPEMDLDAVNKDISKEITESGFAQIFTTELRGKKYCECVRSIPKQPKRIFTIP